MSSKNYLFIFTLYFRLVKSGFESNQNAVKQIKEKELENLKLKCSLEFEKKVNLVENEYKHKLNNNKKEMKKVFDLTMTNMKNTYDDEIKVYKSRLKDNEERIKLMKKQLKEKDKQIEHYKDKVKENNMKTKVKLEQADLLVKLAEQLEEASSTKTGSTRRKSPRYS